MDEPFTVEATRVCFDVISSNYKRMIDATVVVNVECTVSLSASLLCHSIHSGAMHPLVMGPDDAEVVGRRHEHPNTD